jgi:hypothetical protein
MFQVYEVSQAAECNTRVSNLFLIWLIADVELQSIHPPGCSLRPVMIDEYADSLGCAEIISSVLLRDFAAHSPSLQR